MHMIMTVDMAYIHGLNISGTMPTQYLRGDSIRGFPSMHSIGNLNVFFVYLWTPSVLYLVTQSLPLSLATMKDTTRIGIVLCISVAFFIAEISSTSFLLFRIVWLTWWIQLDFAPRVLRWLQTLFVSSDDRACKLSWLTCLLFQFHYLNVSSMMQPGVSSWPSFFQDIVA